VKIDVGSMVVSSAITNRAVDELKLKPSQQANAAIQASDVMLGRLSAEARTVATALMNSDDSSYHTSEAASSRQGKPIRTVLSVCNGVASAVRAGFVKAAELAESQEK
jgi:ribosomal protein L13